MPDIVFVCVRKDLECAEALAEAFENVGFSVEPCCSDEAIKQSAAGVILLSAASAGSGAFAAKAEAVIKSGKAVILSLMPMRGEVGEGEHSFDLTHWDGDPDHAALTPIICAVDDLVRAAATAHAWEVDLQAASTATRRTELPEVAFPPVLTKAPRKYRPDAERRLFVFPTRAMLGAGLCFLFVSTGVLGAGALRTPQRNVAQTANLGSGAPVVAFNSIIATNLSPERVAYRPEAASEFSEVEPQPDFSMPRGARVWRSPPLIDEPDAPA